MDKHRKEGGLRFHQTPNVLCSDFSGTTGVLLTVAILAQIRYECFADALPYKETTAGPLHHLVFVCRGQSLEANLHCLHFSPKSMALPPPFYHPEHLYLIIILVNSPRFHHTLESVKSQ